MTDIAVYNNPGYGCGEAAINAVKRIPATWIPARLNQTTYPARIVQPFLFKIPGSSQPIKQIEEDKPAGTYLNTFVVSAMGTE